MQPKWQRWSASQADGTKQAGAGLVFTKWHQCWNDGKKHFDDTSMFGTEVDLTQAQLNDLEPPQNQLALTACTEQNTSSQLYNDEISKQTTLWTLLCTID